MSGSTFMLFFAGCVLVVHLGTFTTADPSQDLTEDDIDLIALKLKNLKRYGQLVHNKYDFIPKELQKMEEDKINDLLLLTTYARFQYIMSYIRYSTCYVLHSIGVDTFDDKASGEICKNRAVTIHKALESSRNEEYFEFYINLLDRELGATYSIRQAIAQQEKLEKYVERMTRVLDYTGRSTFTAMTEMSKNLEKQKGLRNKDTFTYDEINILLIEFFGEDLQHLSRYMNSAFVDDKEVDSDRLVYPSREMRKLWQSNKVNVGKLMGDDATTLNPNYILALPYVIQAEIPDHKRYEEPLKKLSHIGVKLAYQPSGASEMVFRLDKPEHKLDENDTVRVEGVPPNNAGPSFSQDDDDDDDDDDEIRQDD